jgi:hypothetical protein
MPSFKVLDPMAARTKLVAQNTPHDDNVRELLIEVEKQLKKEPSEPFP